jgi:uncharacterized membrane protein YozB (DUF420 family)
VSFSVEQLPAVNATLNAIAAMLLVTGFALIRSGRVQAHKTVMLTAFGVSIAFLVCYLVYHYHVGSVRFEGPPGVRMVYLAILFTHVVLAAAVPVLAVVTIFFGLTNRFSKHRAIARWTFPIWLYVSVTGVVIYVMLYHLYPPTAATLIINETPVAAMAFEVQAGHAGEITP